MRTARREQNITQKDLAIKTGLNNRLISRYEQGITEPGVSTAIKIADALGFRLCSGPDRSAQGAIIMLRDTILASRIMTSDSIVIEAANAVLVGVEPSTKTGVECSHTPGVKC